MPVVSFDIDARRISELLKGQDRTGEVEPERLTSKWLHFTDKVEDLRSADFHIVTVPTPIDASKQPNLGPLQCASAMIGSILKKGDIVVYESTVYPGVTEDVCIPVLEETSSLKWKVDFNVAYSPERINPGDNERRFDNILRIVSADTTETLEIVETVYRSVVTAQTGLGSYTQERSVFVGAFQISSSVASPARGAKVTLNLTSTEPLARSPIVRITQPGVTPWTVTANKVIGRKYRVTFTLKADGTAGSVEFLVSGTDKYGGKQSSSVALTLL